MDSPIDYSIRPQLLSREEVLTSVDIDGGLIGVHGAAGELIKMINSVVANMFEASR